MKKKNCCSLHCFRFLVKKEPEVVTDVFVEDAQIPQKI
jgi:hypothetical protein